ncbi:MAG TPA: glutathione peroxidase [Aestuariivirga sp.]|nr:glutathione peroxidase [Aestuariivirga sp.]
MTATEKSLHDFTLQNIDGTPMALSQFKGKVVLLVNTASECSYTPQYEGLEELWLANRDKGLVVVGVPSNDFGAQEPGAAGEITSFCKINYGVTFPLTEKLVVKGGAAHPLYQWAAAKAGDAGQPKWNFHKFLFGRNGEFIDWFKSPSKPTGPTITSAVKNALEN